MCSKFKMQLLEGFGKRSNTIQFMSGSQLILSEEARVAVPFLHQADSRRGAYSRRWRDSAKWLGPLACDVTSPEPGSGFWPPTWGIWLPAATWGASPSWRVMPPLEQEAEARDWGLCEWLKWAAGALGNTSITGKMFLPAASSTNGEASDSLAAS